MKAYTLTILLLGLCLLFSHTGTGFAQESFELDEGTTAVRAAGLGVNPQVSKTIGDTTVSLNWAYADAFRLILNYTVTNSSATARFYRSNISISDSADSFFMARAGGGGGFINGQGTEYTYSFGIGLFEPNPAPLALHLELSLEAEAEGYMQGGSGFGTGPFTAAMNPSPGVQVDLGAAPSATPFVFDFVLPVIPASYIEVHQTLVSNNIAVELQSLDVTPSLTHAIVCAADTGRPAGGIHYQGKIVRASDSIEIGLNSAGQTCTDLIYPVSTQPSLTLSIERLLNPAVEAELEVPRANHFAQSLAEQGIMITITEVRDGVVEYRIDSVAEGVNANAVIQTTWDTVFADVLVDPWVFQVNIGN